MIPWRKFAAFCAAQEQKAADRKAARSAGGRLLSYAQFHNTFAAFEGAISNMLEVGGSILVQKVSTCTNDLVVVLRDKLEEIKVWIEQHFMMLENTVKGYFDAYNAAAELRQEQMIAAVYGVYKFMQAEALNQSNRYLELEERLRRMEETNKDQNAINYSTYVHCHNNLMESIQKKMEELHKPRIIREPGPRLEFFTENPDKIIDLGAAFSRLRENDAPPEHAKIALIRSIRTLGDFPITEVDEALKPLLSEWGLAA